MNMIDDLKGIVERVPKDLYMGGSWRPAQEGRTFDVEDPSSGEVLCAVADATPADGLLALDAAVKAQDSWAQHPPRERVEIRVVEHEERRVAAQLHRHA
jgi:succinate-semialdehyde dehydrogenase / glutarate-semialdehyde dehydrogenase